MSSKGQKRKSTGAPLIYESPINGAIHAQESVSKLRSLHDASAPYKHVVIESLCRDDAMRKIHEEATTNMTATFKETDLFKVFQTGDLAVMKKSNKKLMNKMPHLLSLRDSLYSTEFREFIQSITGCGELTDRVDCSANAYTNGCHLLCHDDVIGTRRVSYIIYLTDPDDEWKAREGGALELYPIDETSLIDRGEAGGGLQGVPVESPTICLLPLFNTMAIFAVQPGRSYHAVQEVYGDRPRLSISGWYHGPEAPVGSDLASLKQIMTKGDDYLPFEDFTGSEGQQSPSAQGEEKDTLELTTVDRNRLQPWLNAEYLQPAVMASIRKRFCKDSSMQLREFLRADVAAKVATAAGAADSLCGLGAGRPPADYSVGVGAGWSVTGPPHKRRFMRFAPASGEAGEAGEAGGGVAPETAAAAETGRLLDAVRSLFQSTAFSNYLQLVTSLKPRSCRGESRRFRPGLDYTVAHYGVLTTEPRLDATLCFVSQEVGFADCTDSTAVQPQQPPVAQEEEKIHSKKHTKESESNEEDDEEEEEKEEEENTGDVWGGGDLGGFDCYIEADEDADGAEAAEVYRQEKEEGDEEGTLLSVSPQFNVLNLVLRDEKVMRFVKYVSANAPSSRWDVAVEYEFDADSDSDSGEDDDDDNDDDDDDDEA